MEDRHQRHEKLLELLQDKSCTNQEAICSSMTKLGFQVTQPSISRDLKELGVVKVSGRYLPASSLSEFQQLASVQPLVRTIDTAGPHLIIIRTEVGSANAVAAKVDGMSITGIVGTVAGDDTIFIAIKSKATQSAVIKGLKKLS